MKGEPPKRASARRGRNVTRPASSAERRQRARSLNALFETKLPSRTMDGQTRRRRLRLLDELAHGRNGRPLKPITVLLHAQELLDMGETASSLQTLQVKLPVGPPMSDGFIRVIYDVQAAYDFSPKAWTVLGIRLDKLPPRPTD